MHWYDKNGNARYDANLKTAKSEGLLPSVTSIDKVIANYGLEQYKIRQMFNAAQTVHRDGESDYEYYRKVKRQADKHARDAAKLGTVVHHLIERYLFGRPLFFHGMRSDVWQIFEMARRWIDDNIEHVVSVEDVLVAEDYAGKADCIAWLHDGYRYIIDWKTTDPAGKLKKDGQPKKGRMFYDSHCRQLAALAAAHGTDKVMNVVVSTNTDVPGVWTKVWNAEEQYKALKEFHHAKALWYSINGMVHETV
jgi:hypothetical protein